MNALHNASASKSDLLLRCQWWASPGVRLPEEPERIPDIPRFGRAFHKTMEHYLLGKPVLIAEVAELYDVDAARLEDYYKRGSEAVMAFLKERKWDKISRLVEQKIAYDPFSDTSRVLHTTGERDYSGRKPTELPGTADLALPPSVDMSTTRHSRVHGDEPRPLIVFDWKTGQTSYEAETNPQIHTLSLGLSRYWKANRTTSIGAIGIIVRIDDEFMDLSEAPIPNATLERHRLLLRGKLRAALSSPGMYPGLHCKYCPALEVCPAHRDPLAVVETIDSMIEPAQVAHTYARLVNAEQLLRKVRERVKRYVEMNGPVELDNGKELRIIEYSEENLSKSSIIRALGRLDGELLIGELRDRGVVETSPKRDLRVAGNSKK